MTTVARCLVLSSALLALLGCSRAPENAENKASPALPSGAAAPAATPPAADPFERARRTFRLRCQNCHGERGQGDGPMAAAMPRRPRNHSDKGWQASVTDERIAQVISEGGPAIGLSPPMPSHSDLSPEEVKGLVALIRSFASP